MLKKAVEISKLKERFIIERKEILASNVSDVQKKLYLKLIDRLISALETQEGRILNNEQNIHVSSSLDKVFKEFEIDVAKLMTGVVSDYTKLIGFNLRYFSEFNQALVKSVEANVTEAMQARAGYDSTRFEKDGFIDSFIKDKAIARTIKQQVLSAVLSGTKISDLTKALQSTITGGQQAGILENHFRTYIYDTYSQFDRETSNQFAVQLSMNYGWYQGGLVDHSRPFCIERNDKVFTREEILKFGTPQDKFGGYTDKSKGEFAGKWSKKQGIIYVPERDLGCNNCGHFLNWVSFTIARSIRPEISRSTYDLKVAA